MSLTERDRKRLAGVHPDLVRVIERTAADGARFVVVEGLRSMERQAELVQAGKSQTMRSRHLTGHAVDLAALDDDGKITFKRPAYVTLNEQVQQAARDENVPVQWGGDFKGFFDGPHWQLPWDRYPA